MRRKEAFDVKDEYQRRKALWQQFSDKMQTSEHSAVLVMWFYETRQPVKKNTTNCRYFLECLVVQTIRVNKKVFFFC